MLERTTFEREIELLTEVAYRTPTETEFLVGTTVTFPSGETLPIVTGPDGLGQEYYDPNNSGNPLLNTSGSYRSKKLSKSFTVDELARSGNKKFYKARIDPKLVEYLQAIRDYLNKPVAITSGYRSYQYNVEIYKKRGQRPTKSQHSSGRAADIKIRGMTGVDIAKAAIDACGCNISIGLAPAFAHIDVRGKFNVWNYGGVSKKNVEEMRKYYRERCRK